MTSCIICNKQFNSTRGLLAHVNKIHNLSPKEYYDKNHKPNKCKLCGKDTKFVNYTIGYKTYCSAKCAANSEETKQKRSATNLQKYGCANVSQNAKIKAKKVNTYMSHVDEIKEKVKKTNNERYGCDWITQSDQFKAKYKQKCLDKYGVDNFAKSDEYKKKCKSAIFKNVEYMKSNGYISLHEIIAKYGTGWYQKNYDKVFTYKNKGYIHEQYLDEIKKYLERIKSNVQQEIFDFINMPDAIQNTRSIIKPYELDIYIPSLKLAIESDGIYWHSKVDSKYHLMKTKMCEEKGIRLIHITDWQWNNQQDIIKSILNSALNRFSNVIYARKCTVSIIDNKLAKQFLNTNHIQGGINASKHIGLYYNNELVQLISLGNSRYKKNEYELYRMCTKLNTRVIGGFSKLLNNVKETLYSYVDRSLFNGSGYLATGWILVSETPPSYSYYKQNIKLNRTQTQKSKLPKLLDNFDSNLTEKENMLNNGWLIVYDCGTLKFKKEGEL